MQQMQAHPPNITISQPFWSPCVYSFAVTDCWSKLLLQLFHLPVAVRVDDEVDLVVKAGHRVDERSHGHRAAVSLRVVDADGHLGSRQTMSNRNFRLAISGFRKFPFPVNGSWWGLFGDQHRTRVLELTFPRQVARQLLLGVDEVHLRLLHVAGLELLLKPNPAPLLSLQDLRAFVLSRKGPKTEVRGNFLDSVGLKRNIGCYLSLRSQHSYA